MFINKKNKNSDIIDLISIKSTFISDFIFSLAKKPILYSDLEKLMQSYFDEYPQEKLNVYLWQLFQQGFLLSELSQYLNQTFAFNSLFQKLSTLNLSAHADHLKNIHESMQKYEETSLGDGLPQLIKVIENLNPPSSVKYPIQVDSYRREGEYHLPYHVKKRMEEAASLLWLISQQEPSPLKSYHKFFLEKYGTYRVVLLLELIDPHLGLGLPQNNKDTNSKRGNILQTILLSNINKKEIKLDDLPDLSGFQENILTAPVSIELFFEIHASSQQEIDNARYTLVLNPLVASMQAGSTFGRFLYLWGESKTSELRHFLKKEEALNANSLFVEASFQPDHARTTNVILHEKLRDYHLKMHFHESDCKSIDLQDIYVGASSNNCYLYSKKFQKEIVVSLSNAVNRDLVPPILKLMLDISSSRSNHFSPFFWKEMSDHIYFPRITYQNIVLLPARWSFTYATLKIQKGLPPSEIEKILRKAFEEFDVPKAYLTQFDHRILVDWKNQDHFSLILQDFITNENVFLLETICKDMDQTLMSEKGTHIGEFVVPFVKKEIYKMKTEEFYIPSTDQIDPRYRLQFPGSEWLFVKLYLTTDQEEDFLKINLFSLIKYFYDKQMIDKWFYVRYLDEKPHIRLRLHNNQNMICQNILPYIHDQASKWVIEGIINDFSFHTYEREIERYGGPDCIEAVEEIFCADSHSCLKLHNYITMHELPAHIWGTFGLINILQGFFSLDEQLTFFAELDLDQNYLANLREHSAKAVQLACILFFESEYSNSTDNILAIREFFLPTHLAIKKFNLLLSNSDKHWNSKKSIILSLLHMHCNRFFGIDQADEKKALAITHHLLTKIQYKLKKEFTYENQK